MAAALSLTVHDFIQRVKSTTFLNELELGFKKRFPQTTISESERNSWRNSLPSLAKLLRDANVSGDCHLLLEYPMPLGEMRADALLVGRTVENKVRLFIIELKQWSFGNVTMHQQGEQKWLRILAGEKAYSSMHPCQQVASYAFAIENALDLGEQAVEVVPFVYLHNYLEPNGSGSCPILWDPAFEKYFSNKSIVVTQTSDCPTKLASLREMQVAASDVLRALDVFRLKYSHSFISMISKTLDDLSLVNSLFVTSEDQRKVVREILSILSAAENENKKRLIIVDGIVGTGKTVLAFKLLQFLMESGKSPKYIVHSACINAVLDGAGKTSKNVKSKYLIFDEAHRMNIKNTETENLFINSNFIVAFIDDDQYIRLGEDCSVADLESIGTKNKFEISRYSLSEQLRCGNGQDYVFWVKDFFVERRLDSKLTSNIFDVRLFDSIHMMENELIKLADAGNVTRMLAGYCWSWPTRDDPDVEFDLDISKENTIWKARWNENEAYKKWNSLPGYNPEVGSVFTVQGFEYDYVGVIIGNDLSVSMVDNQPVLQTNIFENIDLRNIKCRNGDDRKLARLNSIVTNIYYVLMTRARKGVFIYVTDEALRHHLKNLIS